MNNVKWILAKSELSRADVLKVEEALGISFPSDYVECVLLRNGGQPVPDTFDFKDRKEAVFNSLIDLNVREKRNVLEVHNNLKNRLPGNVFPFADDPFGNYLCFDYREGNNPSIVFWDHEQLVDGRANVLFVCNSFSDLLDKLYS
ncbi:SMI1/KNR4 family protein [Paenibacillus sp. J45TS6]|uniref:SMI1/KNR4 family protein n=1 Tax=Paenibacillus sp. J45TS6 TaxID=2807196 RepID=UPI001B04C30E|nr:SMI1/KNR4 family protein [Paenibacillus sp. J45TS6]GIP45115.1 SMI1/KNR4 family protein [Paenibacillus sp. J45TS6]